MINIRLSNKYMYTKDTNFKKMIKIFYWLVFYFFFIGHVDAKDPHDDNLYGKNLICFNESLSVDDWGLTFLAKKKVKMFSLNKSIYEIYQHSRTYRTDIRNIIIMKAGKTEYIINRKRLTLGNKTCKVVKGDPLILLQNRIKDLKITRKKGNQI